MSKIVVPRHALDEWTRCHRKWYYRNVLGLVPKEEPEAMTIGNLTHAAIAEGYRRLNDENGLDYEDHDVHFYFLAGAQHGIDLYCFEHPEAHQFRVLVEDMVTYWWHKTGVNHPYSEIVSVEETFYLEAGDYLIPWTADLVARRGDTGGLVVVDHKTVGSVRDAVGFLPLDFQMRRYAAGANQKFEEVPEIDYNMIRRDLPPSFVREDGSTPYAYTATGRESKRSDNPEDYLQFHRLLFTPKQIAETMKELVGDLEDMHHASQTGFYARSEIKGGYNGCTGCPFFGPCTAEFDGKKLDGVTLKFKYNREEPLHERSTI